MGYPFSMESYNYDSPRVHRRMERSSSISSLPPRTASRRDSLFSSSASSCGDDDNEDVMVIAFSAAHLYAPHEPRRRFARRNAFCHFQLLQDAVQTSIDMKGDTSQQRSRSPPALPYYNGADATNFTPPLRRPKILPLINEEERSSRRSERVASYVASTWEGQPRKLSRTTYRTSPSTDAMYSDEIAL